MNDKELGCRVRALLAEDPADADRDALDRLARLRRVDWDVIDRFETCGRLLKVLALEYPSHLMDAITQRGIRHELVDYLDNGIAGDGPGIDLFESRLLSSIRVLTSVLAYLRKKYPLPPMHIASCPMTKAMKSWRSECICERHPDVPRDVEEGTGP